MSSVVLASASPRRLGLLESEGWSVISRPPAIDDGLLGVDVESPWSLVTALAWFKAAQVGPPDSEAFVTVAADTVCVVGGRVLGKPRDRDHAESMLRSMMGRSHYTYSGVCILDRQGNRWLFGDRAEVSIEQISFAELDQYLQSGEWMGKAGGYNLVDRQAAGWPVVCQGDPTTVMGLPLRRLVPFLRTIESESDQEHG